jgi:hypothetical protein
VADPIPNDELISAYLDGELSGAELERAEHLLATEPASRLLLEELRALRATLAGVPRRALGGEFSERVLRRAEREMLSASSAVSESMPSASAARRALLRWPRGKRPWIYAALTAAAALLVMFQESARHAPDVGRIALGPMPQPGEIGAPPANAPAPDSDAERRAIAAPTSAARPLAAAAKPVPPPTVQAPAGAMPQAESLEPAERDSSAAKLGIDGSLSAELARQLRSLGRLDLGPAQVSPDLWIIECEVSSADVPQQPFDRVLTQNSIGMVDEEVNGAQLSLRTQASTAKATAGAPTKEASSAVAPLDSVYVVATRPQIEAALAQLAAEPKLFLRVAVNRESDPAGRALAQAGKDQGEQAAFAVRSLGDAKRSDQAASGEARGQAVRLPIPQDMLSRQPTGAIEELNKAKAGATADLAEAQKSGQQKPEPQQRKRQEPEQPKAESTEPRYQRALFVFRVVPPPAAKSQPASSESPPAKTP